MTHVDYKISTDIHGGNYRLLFVTFFEGEYIEVDGETVYSRGDAISRPVELFFEYYPVSDQDIKENILELLESVRGQKEIIPECL